MEVLFLNFSNEISKLSSRLSDILELDFVEGDSVNVFRGIYYASNFMGMRIQLEYNSYDYEDDYRFMLSINESFSSKYKVTDELKEKIARIMAEFLSINLKTSVAYENGDQLIVYNEGK